MSALLRREAPGAVADSLRRLAAVRWFSALGYEAGETSTDLRGKVVLVTGSTE